MNEHSTESSPPMSDIPEAVVRPATRFRLIWLIPMVAALIGIWLAVRSIVATGPTITIIFKSAEGLQAGKTKIKYKEVEVGRVTGIRLNSNLQEVIVTAEMVKEIEAHLTKNSRFWVVRARLTAGEISGLGTIFSGVYIGLDPGPPGQPADTFDGLEQAPVVTLDMPGTQYHLRAESLGSLDIGSPIYFRQLRVGQVVNYAMQADGTGLDILIFIEAPHDQRVLHNTRFWNASGIDVSLTARGLQIHTDSIVSLLLGGVAFETPANEMPGPRAEPGRQFFLYADQAKIQERVYTEKSHVLAFFAESVRGLEKGSNVEFQGIKVGEVVDIQLQFDADEFTFHVPVMMVIEPERFSSDPKVRQDPDALILQLIEKGLHARLRNGMLLTGQLYIDLTMSDQKPVLAMGPVEGLPVIPTLAGTGEEIIVTISDILNRIEALPIEQIGADLTHSLQSARQLLDSQDLAASLKVLRQSLEQINRFGVTLNQQTAPRLQQLLLELSQVLSQTRDTMASAQYLLGDDAPLTYELRGMIQDLSKAGRAVSALADYLERHPEALIYGKGARSK